MLSMQLYLQNFLSLFVVLGHVQVGNFFLVFSLHTHHFQGDTIKSRQRFDHVVEERKEIQMNQSFPLNSLQKLLKVELLVIILSKKTFDLYTLFYDISLKIIFQLCFIFVFGLNYYNLKIYQFLQFILIKITIITQKH